MPTLYVMMQRVIWRRFTAVQRQCHRHVVTLRTKRAPARRRLLSDADTRYGRFDTCAPVEIARVAAVYSSASKTATPPCRRFRLMFVFSMREEVREHSSTIFVRYAASIGADTPSPRRDTPRSRRFPARDT